MPETAPLRVLSTLAVMGVLQDVIPAREAATRERIEAVYAPTAKLLERIRDGAEADIAILTAEAVDALVAAGTMRAGSRVDLAISVIGVAVKAGAARPDIATPEAFRAALLAAKSIAYSRAGASGIFFAGLIDRLGIGPEVNAKATVIPQGFTAELAANGAVELAIQQVSELMTVAGVDIVGPLPAAVNVRAVFSGGVMAGAATGADELLGYFREASTAGLLEAKGLLPIE
ncbi:MAG: molybdate transporter substrate-binding protein [Belnapia sp.]|nr:molybdate transporter substrate-binding protein [Belnapia sp.]